MFFQGFSFTRMPVNLNFKKNVCKLKKIEIYPSF